MAETRKRGRPPKAPAERKRNGLTMRLRDALKDRLRLAAEQNQRSLSEEAEARLETSFTADLAETIAETVVRKLRNTQEGR